MTPSPVTAPGSITTTVRSGDLRMLTALLAACDPAGHASSSAYGSTARLALTHLRAGADACELTVSTGLDDAPVEGAHAFARAAFDWWVHSADRDRPRLDG